MKLENPKPGEYVLASSRVHGYESLSPEFVGTGKSVQLLTGSPVEKFVGFGTGKRGAINRKRILVLVKYSGREWFAWVDHDQLAKS